ncbi:MAG: Biopolymer transport protein [Gammaproteobacteria bacterium]|jgi:biopolymer transport protein TolR|nr:Biopolymer transport protein [Gammaproteobacteria bacterium]
MLRKRNRRQKLSEMNVVPYIDVMLVLLIIFMVTTPLLSQGVKVSLPKASANVLPQEKQAPVIVTVNAQGLYFLNIAANANLPITPAVLSESVKSALQQNPDRKVYVRGDQGVEYGKVVNAMVILQQAGAPSVGLMTDDSRNTGA